MCVARWRAKSTAPENGREGRPWHHLDVVLPVMVIFMFHLHLHSHGSTGSFRYPPLGAGEVTTTSTPAYCHCIPRANIPFCCRFRPNLVSASPCTRQAVDGPPVVRSAGETPAVTPASLVVGVSSEESLPPSGDGMLAGTGADVKAAASGEEVMVSPPILVVDDTTPAPESVEIVGESADSGSTAVGSSEKEVEEDGQTADTAPLSRVAELRQVFGQSTPVETAVGGAVAPETVSAAAGESVDSPQLDLDPLPEPAESVPAVSSTPAAEVDGATAAAVVDQESPVDGEEVEQPIGLAGEEGAAVADVVVETAEAVEGGAVDVPGPSEPSLAVASHVPEVEGVDESTAMVDDVAEVRMTSRGHGEEAVMFSVKDGSSVVVAFAVHFLCVSLTSVLFQKEKLYHLAQQ